MRDDVKKRPDANSVPDGSGWDGSPSTDREDTASGGGALIASDPRPEHTPEPDEIYPGESMEPDGPVESRSGIHRNVRGSRKLRRPHPRALSGGDHLAGCIRPRILRNLSQQTPGLQNTMRSCSHPTRDPRRRRTIRNIPNRDRRRRLVEALQKTPTPTCSATSAGPSHPPRR